MLDERDSVSLIIHVTRWAPHLQPDLDFGPWHGSRLRPALVAWLGHLGPGRAPWRYKLVRHPRRLPESLAPGSVDAFMASPRTHQDRTMILAMLLGVLSPTELRALKLADVDMRCRRLWLADKGGKERKVPAGQVLFAELVACLWLERLPRLANRNASWCCAANHGGAGRRGRAGQPVPPAPGDVWSGLGPPAPSSADEGTRIAASSPARSSRARRAASRSSVSTRPRPAAGSGWRHVTGHPSTPAAAADHNPSGPPHNSPQPGPIP